MHQNSKPFPFTVSAQVGPLPVTSGVLVTGISAACTTAATITLHSGGVSSGPVVAAFALGANLGLTPGCLPHIYVDGGLYIVVTGTVSGAVYIQ